MSKKATLTIFYGVIALICVVIIMLSRYLHNSNEARGDLAQARSMAELRMSERSLYELNASELMNLFVNAGKTETGEWFKIEKDLVATNQEGREVRLSDLKGKVWLVANFFAVCPMCAQRNGEELHKIYDEFGDNPDFHIVCISVDPENDDVEKLKAYGKAVNADPKNWWFLNAGSEKETHDYLEQVLKFFRVEERKNPVEIESNGRFQHDLGFFLVNREMGVVGKWPMSEARSPEAKALYPDIYDQLKTDLFEHIRSELDKTQ